MSEFGEVFVELPEGWASGTSTVESCAQTLHVWNNILNIYAYIQPAKPSQCGYISYIYICHTWSVWDLQKRRLSDSLASLWNRQEANVELLLIDPT